MVGRVVVGRGWFDWFEWLDYYLSGLIGGMVGLFHKRRLQIHQL